MPLDSIDKTQLAAQAVAVIRSSFKQPSDEQIAEILSMALGFVTPPALGPEAQKS